MEKKVVKNTAVLTVANLAGRVIGFFYFIFLGRILGVEKFGHYNFALALVYNFYPVADFGIERLILRDLSKDKSQAQQYFQKIIPLRLIFSLVSIVLVTVLGLILSNSTLDRINILVFSLCLLPWTFTQLVAGIGNAFEKMEIQSLVIVLMSLLTAIFGGIIAYFKGSVTQVLAAAFLANLTVALIALVSLRKLGLKFQIEIDVKFLGKILKEAWVFAVIMIIAVFYLRSSVVMVNYFKGAYYTGLYSSAFKFIEASLLIPQSFALALFPQAARLLESDKKRLGGNYLKSLGVIFVFALGYAVFFYLFSPLIIGFSYGPAYLEAVSTLRILGFSAIPFFLNTLPGNIIQNSKKIKGFLIFILLNFVSVVVFGILLIPRYSIIGASLAVLLGEIVGLIFNNLYVFKILNEKD